MIVGQDRLYVECTEGVVVISEYPRHGCYVTFSNRLWADHAEHGKQRRETCDQVLHETPPAIPLEFL